MTPSWLKNARASVAYDPPKAAFRQSPLDVNKEVLEYACTCRPAAYRCFRLRY